MATDFQANIPIYIQLVNIIRSQIALGELQPGEKVAAVRELAAVYSVNPNTMQRALAELERDGLMFTERTTGRFVTQDVQRIDKLRQGLAADFTQQFLKKMFEIGYSKEQIKESVEKEVETYGQLNQNQ